MKSVNPYLDKTMTTTKLPKAAMARTTTTTGPSIVGARGSNPSPTTTLFSEAPASEGDLEKNATSRFRFRLGRILDRPEEAVVSDGPVVSPIEPYLHMLPTGLHTCYRPLPRLVQGLNVVLALGMGVVSTTWERKASVSYLFWIRKAIALLLKAVVYALLTQLALQESIFKSRLGPSRVTIKKLKDEFFLPTSLSRYEPVVVEGPSALSNEKSKLGIHYLEYENPSKEERKRRFSAAYFQHGFGASSLSWLPALPSLTQTLGADVALGHDAVGFGFTDRPTHPLWYTPLQSARIAQALLESKVPSTNSAETCAPVCLVGHSMGSRSILRLAARLPKETPKLIILSSPALGLIKTPPVGTAQTTDSSSTKKSFLTPIVKWILRRVVGTPNAWKKGLQAAWGDPSKVRENSEVLRYSWPSIGLGWEDGLLRFARGQMLPMEDDLDDDAAVFRHILENHPNTKIMIILGSKDKVVPTANIKAFLNSVESNNTDPVVVELEGLGHCAFEEDPETFCTTVEQLVAEHWDSNIANESE